MQQLVLAVMESKGLLFAIFTPQNYQLVIIPNMLLQVLIHPRVLLADKQGLHLRADRQGGSDQADQEGARLVAKTPLRAQEAPLAESRL